MFDCSHWCFRIFADVCLLSLVGIPILAFYLEGNPYKRGFFCDDDSIRYPYRDSTVPTWLLYCYGFGLPIVIIIITEWVSVKFYADERRTTKSFFWECYAHVVAFLFGSGCCQLLTDIGKYTIGRLRPHFYQVCKPNVDCTDPSMKNVYVEKFQCYGKDPYLLQDMRLSFPSGHSSFSAYSMVFLTMYCSGKLVWSGSKWVRHVIQYFAIVLALYTGLTRISDYKHHWSDVLAGLVLGTLTAVIIVLFVSDLFPRRSCSGECNTEAPPTEEFSLRESVEDAHRKYTVI